MEEQKIVDSLIDNYMPYTAYVIMQRAIPEIDGFKPSQRRILYTMYKMGLLKGERRKSQGVVGRTMFLHGHGDASIYQTIVRMSKDNEALLVPYIDSKGNFGKHYSRDMQEASPRYTEIKLADVSSELFKNINKDSVDMIDNYDGTLKEPRLLPTTFPNILTNSQNGMAVGMSSNIPSFNLSEVIDYTIAYLKNQKSEPSDYITAPDFPTGGEIVYNKKTMDEIFDSGKGSFKIRARYKIEGDSIIFYEMPYTANFEDVIDRITKLVKDGKFKDIVDIHDIYGINDKGIEIVTKKNTNKEVLVEQLFKMTKLEDTFSSNINIIVDGNPKVLGVKGVIDHWIKFRAKTIAREARHDKAEKLNKIHLLSALKKVLLDIDRAISIVKDTKTDRETLQRLTEAFEIDFEQAEYVSNIKLKHLNKEYIINKTNDIVELKKDVEDLDDLINNKKVLAKRIIKELEEIKTKYGEERRTGLVMAEDIVDIPTETIMVEDYNVKVFITKEGYLKKVPLTSLRGNYSLKVKDDDEIIKEFETTNTAELIVLTDKRNVYKKKLHEIQDNKPSNLGEYIPTMLSMSDETPLFSFVTSDFSENLIACFEDGKVAKIEVSAYETKQNRSLLKNGYADKNIVYFDLLGKDEDIDLFAKSSIGKVILFNTSMINSKTSKTTIGSTVLKEKDNSKVVLFVRKEDADIEDTEYYRIKNAGVGKYLRKEDTL